MSKKITIIISVIIFIILSFSFLEHYSNIDSIFFDILEIIFMTIFVVLYFKKPKSNKNFSYIFSPENMAKHHNNSFKKIDDALKDMQKFIKLAPYFILITILAFLVGIFIKLVGLWVLSLVFIFLILGLLAFFKRTVSAYEEEIKMRNIKKEN